jgi:hypothetical protein
MNKGAGRGFFQGRARSVKSNLGNGHVRVNAPAVIQSSLMELELTKSVGCKKIQRHTYHGDNIVTSMRFKEALYCWVGGADGPW